MATWDGPIYNDVFHECDGNWFNGNWQQVNPPQEMKTVTATGVMSPNEVRTIETLNVYGGSVDLGPSTVPSAIITTPHALTHAIEPMSDTTKCVIGYILSCAALAVLSYAFTWGGLL